MRLLLLLCALGWALFAFTLWRRPAPAPVSPPAVTVPDEYKRGEELAKVVCNSCHLQPAPEQLDKVTWALEVLPRMTYWLGGLPFDYDHHPGGAVVREAGIIPQAPLIGVQDWRAICVYILESAPSVLVRSNPAPVIHSGLSLFQPVTAAYRRDPPMTTLVKIDPQHHQLYVGDAGTGMLEQLNALGQPERSMKIGGAPVSLTFAEDGW